MITPPVPVAIDHDRLLKIFVDILSVDSYWGNEDRVVAILQPMLEEIGVVCTRDEIGNLIGKWPAKVKQTAPIMLNAHMDTVQPTPDMRPVVKADGVYSDGSSVLGADDKAGVAVIVEAVLAVHDAGLDHGPIELVFTVGEDVGQFGADAFDPNDIEARVAFVLDAGGPVGDLVTQQAGSYGFEAVFHGKAAHAGIAAGDGINAIAMQARAVDNMPLGKVDGRHGRQRRRRVGRPGGQHRAAGGQARRSGPQPGSGGARPADGRHARGLRGRCGGVWRTGRLHAARPVQGDAI